MSEAEGENMFAIQIWNMLKTEQKVAHCEFIGCIAEDVEDEEDAAPENEDGGVGVIQDLINYLCVSYSFTNWSLPLLLKH